MELASTSKSKQGKNEKGKVQLKVNERGVHKERKYYFCKQSSHFKKDCPKRKKWFEKKEKSLSVDILKVFIDEVEKQLDRKVKVVRLKQAPKQWYLKFNDTITLYGFVENIVDQCIYMK
ncbi:hypothetical protein CR513_15971, partial [Mucuna pruriens]